MQKNRKKRKMINKQRSRRCKNKGMKIQYIRRYQKLIKKNHQEQTDQVYRTQNIKIITFMETVINLKQITITSKLILLKLRKNKPKNKMKKIKNNKPLLLKNKKTLIKKVHRIAEILKRYKLSNLTVYNRYLLSTQLSHKCNTKVRITRIKISGRRLYPAVARLPTIPKSRWESKQQSANSKIKRNITQFINLLII
jgi:hypothetical protein